MKVKLVGKGFSTVELVIALAILSLVLSGAILADWSATYWNVSTPVAFGGIEEMQRVLGSFRETAVSNFYAVTASTSTACSAGFCYYDTVAVTDISSCAKYVDVATSWHIPFYATSTESVASTILDSDEALKEGGDCLLDLLTGSWAVPAQAGTADFSGNPTGIDVLGGVAYVTTDQSPYFVIASSSVVSFANSFTDPFPLNAIDVARDGSHVYDVTDPQNPTLLAQTVLQKVTVTSSQANGWRLFYYDHTVYFVTRFISGVSPELHVFDVTNPAQPIEVGQYKLSTSAYSLIARDQVVNGVSHRFLYLGTTADTKELMVLDVTDPAHIYEVTGASYAFPTSQQAFALALTGNTLYLGRDSVPTGEELYAFDVTNPLTATSGLPILGKTDIATDSFSRHVEALRVSDPFLFVATTNTTNAHGQIQVRSSDPATNFALIGTYSIPRLAENGIDLDDDFLYALATTSPRLIVLTSL
jgi:hypothetical protein